MIWRSKVKVIIDIYGNKVVNMIETKPLCASSSNFADMCSYSERMDPIDFGGQRLKVKVTMDIYDNKLVNMIETKPFFASSSNFARHVSHSERMVPIRFWRSQVKVQGHN